MSPDGQGLFAGKRVLVTGGSRGIGRAIALRFASLGASEVAISYLRNDTAARETAGELEALGTQVKVLRGNLGDPDKVAALVEEAGPLDVLVSNAATGVIRPLLELEEKHWDWTLNGNARALFSLARHAAPSMPPGSAIVAISLARVATACSTTTRSWGRRRRRSSRSSATSRSSSRRRTSA